MEITEKPIIEWLEELPEPYRSQAIKNCKKYNLYTGDNIRNSLSDALSGAFLWDCSSQGGKYWNDLHNKLLASGK